jgi:hypothetical protein
VAGASPMLVHVGSGVTTLCLMAGTEALVDKASALRRPSSRCSSAAHAMRHAGVRLQLFPGDDPWDFVRQNARERAAEHMAMEEAERGEPLSHAFKTAYADALVDLEVKDAMAGKVERHGHSALARSRPCGVHRFKSRQSTALEPLPRARGCLSVPNGVLRRSAIAAARPKVASL